MDSQSDEPDSFSEEAQTPSPVQRVIITGIDIPFVDLLLLLFKWVFAVLIVALVFSIPVLMFRSG